MSNDILSRLHAAQRGAAEAIGVCAECCEAECRCEAAICEACDGEGRIPNWSGCGDQAGGMAETCQECKGTGEARL